MNVNKRARVVGALVLFCLSVQQRAMGCDESDQPYRLAVELSGKQAFAAAKEQLNKSVENCGRYSNWYLLGRMHQKLDETELALDAFKQARLLATTDNQRAIAIARYAEVLSISGSEYEALSLIQAAKEMHSEPAQWMLDLMFQLDSQIAKKPMTQALVTRSLGAHQFGLLPDESKPTVNIRINFQFDSVEVDDFSKRNLEALAATLVDSNYNGKRFRLIGHTDLRGENGYNDNLSVARAKEMHDYLVHLKPELNGRLEIEGHGESEPLYTGDSEEEHRLNRRLQIVVD